MVSDSQDNEFGDVHDGPNEAFLLLWLPHSLVKEHNVSMVLCLHSLSGVKALFLSFYFLLVFNR